MNPYFGHVYNMSNTSGLTDSINNICSSWFYLRKYYWWHLSVFFFYAVTYLRHLADVMFSGYLRHVMIVISLSLQVIYEKWWWWLAKRARKKEERNLEISAPVFLFIPFYSSSSQNHLESSYVLTPLHSLSALTNTQHFQSTENSSCLPPHRPTSESLFDRQTQSQQQWRQWRTSVPKGERDCARASDSDR